MEKIKTNTGFEYNLNGITISEDDAEDIYWAFAYHKEIVFLNTCLKLNDMSLAKDIHVYYCKASYDIEDDVAEAVWDYIRVQLAKYMIENNYCTKEDLTMDDDNNFDNKCILWDKAEKYPELNVDSKIPLCKELEPLRQLRIKLFKYIDHEDDEN